MNIQQLNNQINLQVNLQVEAACKHYSTKIRLYVDFFEFGHTAMVFDSQVDELDEYGIIKRLHQRYTCLTARFHSFMINRECLTEKIIEKFKTTRFLNNSLFNKYHFGWTVRHEY